ncbi:MAG: succinate dehydrogenase assembly factor 2 [Spongiibacteraceae bacterium]|jgi:antitoxin CptB|nr:succinate dehydrogenase assembly factor 2 [Spongiibacteraceae bacterium]
MSEKLLSEEEYRRIRWASRRGMLELDLVLQPFVEHRVRALDAEGLGRYLRLLECEDTELFAWFLGKEQPQDEELTRIVDEIIRFARSTER